VRRTVFEHQSDGVFGHDACLALILSVGEDFRKGGDPNGEPARFFGRSTTAKAGV
jgi:hypothetical protein